jgi:Tfp pilus assembly protein PilN
VRAVNLIPAEDRRAAGAPGRTGGGVYIALGLLAVVVIAACAYALTTNQVNQRKADLQKTTLEANAAEAQAAAVKPYADFAQLKDQRVQTVQSLAGSRFDWHKLMDEFARAIPSDVRLSGFSGQTATPDSGSGQTTSGPSVAIQGCTSSHKDVARLMTRLRLIDGVTDVALSSSAKGESSGGSEGGAADCKGPAFQMTITFDASTATAAAQTGTATTQPAATGGTP